ncbi:hypothetical protein EYF80_013047 [Liparis tanakae]|uniref:Uncharacterized protein n=1 Tax=Liparis tanakae TaxID=230148 RepID=A0A4Z2IFS4_9TELE|nr:hypothetical protein EYF80_013047 [Liparis tanakae]
MAALQLHSPVVEAGDRPEKWTAHGEPFYTFENSDKPSILLKHEHFHFTFNNKETTKDLNPKKVTKLAYYNALEKFTKNLTKSQNGETLQSECKKKVDQVEDQIHQRDTEIPDLSKTEESLSEKLT